MLDRSCKSTQQSSQDTSLDYVQRVNRAIDYILHNLEHPLKLEVVAKAACFSPFHFHRIFRSLLGETLSQFVKRLRLERALSMLSRGSRRSLTDIALEACVAGAIDLAHATGSERTEDLVEGKCLAGRERHGSRRV